MATASRRQHRDVKVLHRVPYAMYAQLVEDEANRHVRMSYHNGTLEIVSPIYLAHERPSARLRLIVTTVADALGLAYEGCDSSTFKKAGDGPFLGVGKEPDQSFYIPNVARLPRELELNLEAGDPPPDLWIEVDNRVSSAGRLPVYATLGVPEVWRYRVKSRKFQMLGLTDGQYREIERSLSLPVLTPSLVLEALSLGGGLREVESDWVRMLRDWARRLVETRADRK
ncbi:Uma2 family endonuclease [Tundrisphaera sp. TA3]|uniref:Uma2 family endonuclease n=1 Tax=Tundrisphaera sp. TA3 TaxID=3435775 RepID=UPI003EBF7C9A